MAKLHMVIGQVSKKYRLTFKRSQSAPSATLFPVYSIIMICRFEFIQINVPGSMGFKPLGSKVEHGQFFKTMKELVIEMQV
jgi:hypothetical protein